MTFSETVLLRSAVARLRTWLPSSWRAERPAAPSTGASLQLSAPDGQKALLVLTIKRTVEPKDVPRIADQLGRDTSRPKAKPVVVAPYLSPRTRHLLSLAGIDYLDDTGNAQLQLDGPALVIRMQGEDRDPKPLRRSLKSLRGRAAGRALRALCDFAPPYGIRELAERSSTPAPTLSRVASLLVREAVVARESSRGPLVKVDWEALLRLWVNDYDFVESNRTATFLEPRGLDALVARLRETPLDYAVTGTLSAHARDAAVSAPRLMMLYVRDVEAAAEQLGLRPADAGGNVLLAEAFDPVALERTVRKANVHYAACSQTVVDLLTGPGRAPADGEALIAWMRDNEDVWRT